MGGINLIPPFPQVSLVEEAVFSLLPDLCVDVAFRGSLPGLAKCLSERNLFAFQATSALCPSCSDYQRTAGFPTLSSYSSKKLPGISVLLARMFHFALASKCLSSAALGASVTPIQLLSLRMSNLMRPSAPCSIALLLDRGFGFSAVVGRNGAAVC